MRMRALLAIAVALLTVPLLYATPASAQATRTWVSGVGDDLNPCSRTAPCKTFAGAISKTATGGEISVLDPGGFGAVTVTKSISITNDGAGEAGILGSFTNGVIVNGANIVVNIKGVVIDGAGTGLNGIRVLNAKAVNVEDCVIKNFNSASAGNGFGIAFQPSSVAQLNVNNCTIENNGSAAGNGGAINVSPTGAGGADVSLFFVKMVNNTRGLIADGSASTGGINVTLANGVSAGATAAHGVLARSPGGGSSATEIMVADSSIVNNALRGLSADGAGATVRFANNQITGNGTGTATSNGGTLQSYGNNQIDGNTGNGANPPVIPQK